MPRPLTSLLAVAVTASALTFEQVSFLQATMDVKPGEKPKSLVDA